MHANIYLGFCLDVVRFVYSNSVLFLEKSRDMMLKNNFVLALCVTKSECPVCSCILGGLEHWLRLSLYLYSVFRCTDVYTYYESLFDIV